MSIMSVLVLVSFLFAAIPALLYARNTKLFHRLVPFRSPELHEKPKVSVLIPARNEEVGIKSCLESVLASLDVDLEVIVLDDHSTDRTASLVQEFRERDPRVRLEQASALPAGWCGKQYACLTLAKLATSEIITFLDADVRLSPHALHQLVAYHHLSRAALVSGLPKQQTVTGFEKLIIPLIHWLLLSFLPFDQMRKSVRPSLGAGCGQWFLTTREAYNRVGGHGHTWVRNSMHDGITLPRAYRSCGLMTDVCDATTVAGCRMYRNAGQVWNGFAKNAREGLGAPRLIWIWTIILPTGQIVPFFLLALHSYLQVWEAMFVIASWSLVFLPRFHAVIRFQQSVLGAVLHPIAILGLLGIQWYATIRVWCGKPVGWKGRMPAETLTRNAHP